jgi:hypothetical protein
MTNATRAFQELILQANRAHRAYNVSGAAVAQNALFDLRALALNLMQHLATQAGEEKKGE